MEENTSPTPQTKTFPWSKIIAGLVIIIAFSLIGIGAYVAGSHRTTLAPISPSPTPEVLGTESTITPVPTEIPSLADTPTPTPTPTSTPVVKPTIKVLSPPKKLYAIPSSTPTPTVPLLHKIPLQIKSY